MVNVIAEIGSNWDPIDAEGSIRALFKEAAGAGCTHVKMQDWAPIHEMRRPDEWKDRCDPWTMPPEMHAFCKGLADEFGVRFLTSAFTWEAVIRAMGNDVVKIASSEATNTDLLRVVRYNATDRHTVLVSLGGVGDEDAGNTVLTIGLNTGFKIALMACVPEYPASLEKTEREIKRVARLADERGVWWGLSSHVAYPEALEAAWHAVCAGARWVEAHMRVGDTPTTCPDNGPWSLLPDQLADLVATVREAE